MNTAKHTQSDSVCVLIKFSTSSTVLNFELFDSSVNLLSSLSILYTEQLNTHRTDLIMKCFCCKISRLLWLGSRCPLSLSPSFTSSGNIGSVKKKRSLSECERSILTYCIKPCKSVYQLSSQPVHPHTLRQQHRTRPLTVTLPCSTVSGSSDFCYSHTMF